MRVVAALVGAFWFFFRMGPLEDEVVGCWILGREGVWWR